MTELDAVRDFPADRRELMVLSTAIAFIAIGMAILAGGRAFPNYGTETDFLGSFVPEARHILRGESLTVAFHPPLYAAVLALTKTLIGRWFRAGLLISWLSACAVLVTASLFFGRLAGRFAAYGSLAVLGTSHVFLQFSAQATSDVFFLALYCGASLAALTAYRRPEGRLVWVTLGAVLGVCLLTRTNGLTLLVFLATPWLVVAAPRVRLERTAWAFLGLSAPVLMWAVVAKLSGSPLAPSGTYANLAMTYFGRTNRINAEDLRAMYRQFDGIWDVLAYDPASMLRVYATNLFDLPQVVFNSPVMPLVMFPLGLLALPGIIVFFLAPLERFKLLFGTATLLQIALVNLKTFEARFYLFLLPIIGAGLGLTSQWLYRRCGHRRGLLTGSVIAVYCLAALALTIERVQLGLHRDDAEVRSISLVARELIPANSRIVARKPHMAYYANSREVYFPEAASLSALRDSLRSLEEPPDFLFYGKAEAQLRPELNGLLNPDAAPSWLQPVKADGSGNWALYRVVGVDNRSR